MKVPEPAAKTTKDRGLSLTSVLVATDFSPVSDLALTYAVALARHYGAQVYLTHVVTEGQAVSPAESGRAAYEKMRRVAEQGIADILKSGRMRGVAHEVLLEEGYLWEVIERLIHAHKISLVTVGTHGVRSVQGEFMGSSAEMIFRRAECPVLTVGPASAGKDSGEVEFKKILFATNFGRAAEHAAPYAFSLAQEYRAMLTLLHVMKPSEEYSEKGLAMLQETTRYRLEQCLPPGIEQWCKAECVVKSGECAEEILQAARAMKADLVVMGAGRKHLVTHLPQSAAYTVAAGAPCPVLTVRA
ncbi:MAG: universal stress protein [Acidobacteriia bacterium]|nr:universal stress protein [Terriglobia bacterium]